MLLKASHLKKDFKKGLVKAVDDVSMEIENGKTLGVVGESGSGKSTLAKLLLKLLKADGGQILFEGRDITVSDERNLKEFRKKVQVIFQEPFSSLDPRFTVRNILREPYLIAGQKNENFLEDKVRTLLRKVELGDDFLSRLPHEMSGGECQRVAIARAISTEPSLIVCDEPVSSLDALVQVQILNLLLKLQQEKRVAYLFISHDLRVVRHMSDDILVMKDGQVVEAGPRDQVFNNPQDPYSKKLLKD